MERYRIGPEAAVYFLTYSVVEWLPIFISEATCNIVTASLSFCHQHKCLRINAFVIMPTHLHLIVFDADFETERLTRTLADLRKFTGRQLSDVCKGRSPRCFEDVLREKATADRERRLWQPSRHAEAIQTEAFWQQKLNYLHDNPCRKGLVRRPEHWRFSSAAWYVSEGKESVDVPLTPIAW
jgi:REP element-mobilizing transposase RayT